MGSYAAPEGGAVVQDTIDTPPAKLVVYGRAFERWRLPLLALPGGVESVIWT